MAPRGLPYPPHHLLISMTFEAHPFPRERMVTVQGGRLASKKHTVYGLIEVDVTEPRQKIRDYKERTGETISFTAFLIACLGKAVDADKRIHAYRDWRNRLILFDDVDVNTMIEVQAEGRTRVVPHWVRAANHRSLRDIHDEIRKTQQKPEETTENNVKWMGYLPGCIWSIFFWFIFKNPHSLKTSFGTVGVTSVGIFGQGTGWAIPFGLHTLDVAIGSITKKPAVVDDQIQVREFLCLTLCFDHDIVDGGPAARFTQRFKEIIENGQPLDEFLEESSNVDGDDHV